MANAKVKPMGLPVNPIKTLTVADEGVLEPIVKAGAPVADPMANPAKVKFELDRYGFTTRLRKDGLAAAGRVNGCPDKLAVFMGTLQTLMDHAQARFKRDNGGK